MSVNLPPVSSTVTPAQNDEMRITSSRDVLKGIFSYLSPKALLNCVRVNKEWTEVANYWLNKLELPSALRYPIYTRVQYIEKLQNAVAGVELNQRFSFQVVQFRKKEVPLPIIQGSFQSNNVSGLPEKPPINFLAKLDEVSQLSVDGYPRRAALSFYGSLNSSTVEWSVSAPENLAKGIEKIFSAKRYLLTASAQ